MNRWLPLPVLLVVVLALAEGGCLVATDAPPPKSQVSMDGASVSIPCLIFPANDVWNTPIDQLQVDDHSGAYVQNMEPQSHLHAGFGSGRTGEWGVAYFIANEDTPLKGVPATQVDDSDHGLFPLPNDPPIAHSPNGVLSVIDPEACLLYEYNGLRKDADRQWTSQSVAVFDLRSHILRRTGAMSADPAGLPIFPGLVRYEEVAAGAIKHALRFSTPHTRKLFVWPARHAESNIFDASYPPMGARFRLKSSFRVDDFSRPTQVILRALQNYGMFLAENGAAWTISGSPDKRWNDVQLTELERVPASALEMVDEDVLISDVNLGVARQPGDVPVSSGDSALDSPAAPSTSPATKPGATGAPKQKKN